jgi:hypothetical protein
MSKLSFKTIFTTSLFMFFLQTVNSILQFHITDNPKCYIEEFVVDSIAVLKWKIVGLPVDPIQHGINLILK